MYPKFLPEIQPIAERGKWYEVNNLNNSTKDASIFILKMFI
jgi:hypothetical protein